MAGINWAVVILGTIAHNIFNLLKPSGQEPSPPPFPPPPPPPPPTRCFDLDMWLAAAGSASPSVGISPGNAGSAFALWSFLLLSVVVVLSATCLQLSRAARIARTAGASGPGSVGPLSEIGSTSENALAMPASKSSARSKTAALVVLRFHAKLRELQAKRQRKVVVFVRPLKRAERKRLLAAQRRVMNTLKQRVDEQEASYDKLVFENARLVEQNRELERLHQKVVLRQIIQGREQYKLSERVFAAEERAAQAEARLQALRAAGKAPPTVSHRGSQTDPGNPDAAPAIGPAETAPEGSSAAAIVTGPSVAVPKAHGDVQAPQGLPAVAGLPSSEIDVTAGEGKPAPVDTEAPPTQVPPAAAAAVCWASTTKPCQGDVAKGKPCCGDPDKYDAEHRLIYDWEAPDWYYGPYQASTFDRELKKGSLARKQGLCVDCFNAKNKCIPAKEPYGPRKPVKYLF